MMLPPSMPDGSAWPTISIVTPSLNQGAFIEETIRSVADQNYPHIEHIVIDGGSTDCTAEILHRHAGSLAFSEVGEGFWPEPCHQQGHEARERRDRDLAQ